ncbi:putative endo-beta-1,4-glucanase D [Paramyrothecium foliicola]|nr:putative endo-beta-1,4-glucanase D [Paramyrothecium foliicola]
MRFTAASVLAMASTVSAHALVYGVWVNDVDQGDGRQSYIRTPPNNSPVKDLSSPDLVCNVNGAKPASDFVSVAAGDTVSVEWQHDNRHDDIIDGSHKGPIITWIAEYTEGAGTGAIWTKIAEDGFDGKEWAVDKIKANKGRNDFVLPASLKAGKYLLRQEIIAGHEADATYDKNPARGAQFYPSCIQIDVSGTGSAVPDQGFDFNKDYTYADPGIQFNIYGAVSSYAIPGPAVWTGEGSGSAPQPTAAPAPTSEAPAPTSEAPAPAPTGEAPAPTSEAPAPVTTSIAPVEPQPTTLVTKTSSSAPATPTEPANPPVNPPSTCKRKRSHKRRHARRV